MEWCCWRAWGARCVEYAVMRNVGEAISRRCGRAARVAVGRRPAGMASPGGCLQLHSSPSFDLPTPPLQGSRYDDNIAVFGRTLQQKMESLKIFLVREKGGGREGEAGWEG